MCNLIVETALSDAILDELFKLLLDISKILKFTVLFRMLDSQKRGFVPPGYLHSQPQQHHQQQQGLHPAAPHLSGYSPYCHPGSLHPGFFPAGGGEERARSTTTSPVGSSPDGALYASATAASPPTPPVTPGNRHQLPSHQHHQQLGTGHVTASISPPGI